MFAYWVLFNMQQILVSFVLQTEQVDNAVIFIYVVVCLVAVIFTFLGIFIRPKALSAYRRNLFHRSYGHFTFPLFLITIILLDVFLLLAITVNTVVFYVTPLFPLIVMIYVAARRPFKLVWNNVRLFIV